MYMSFDVARATESMKLSKKFQHHDDHHVASSRHTQDGRTKQIYRAHRDCAQE